MTATHGSAANDSNGTETAGQNRFTIMFNKHTSHYDVRISKQELFGMMDTDEERKLRVVVDRSVTVCSHASRHLAEECARGISCAYGTPVGRLA